MGLACFAFGKCLANTNNRRHLVFLNRHYLCVHSFIRLAKNFASFTVTNNHITYIKLCKKRSRYFTCESTRVCFVAVLSTKNELQFVGINHRLNTSQVCKWWMNRHINFGVVFFGQNICKLLHTLNRFIVIVIHLPVSRNNRFSQFT